MPLLLFTLLAAFPLGALGGALALLIDKGFALALTQGWMDHGMPFYLGITVGIIVGNKLSRDK
jgi:hypothetical protein|tara:strand:+ start:1512 stop:1700 length:189 start_codon:yes stop_codon:yes gene_type:complete